MESSHRDAAPNLVWEDMSVMSDFELHNLCTLYKVCVCGGVCVWVGVCLLYRIVEVNDWVCGLQS